VDLDSTENNSTDSIFKIFKALHTELNNCAKTGNLDEECVKKLNLTEFIQKIISKKSEYNIDINNIGQIVKETLDQEGILKKNRRNYFEWYLSKV